MAVTNEQVRAFLDRDEPDYEAGARMGPEALPILRRFVEDDDPTRAAKAASLAGRIAHPDAAPIPELAARSTHTGVRVAAAHAVRYVGEAAEPVLVQLVDDEDPAVRKTALKSIPQRPGKELLTKVGVLQRDEATPWCVRSRATSSTGLPNPAPKTRRRPHRVDDRPQPWVAADRWYSSCVNPLGWLDRLGAQRTEKGQALYVLYVIIAVLVIIVLLRILGVV